VTQGGNARQFILGADSERLVYLHYCGSMTSERVRLGDRS
jgi:hypothetical protein